MSLDDDLTRVVRLTRLIGLGEAERRVYEHMFSLNEVEGDLVKAYRHHEEELKLLIKYQQFINKDKRDICH